MSQLIKKGQCIQGSDLAILAYVATNDGNRAIQSDLSSITVSVVDKTSDDKTVTGTYTPGATDCIFDDLQLDSRWKEGGEGYNFAFTIPAEAFVSGDVTYRVEVLFTFATGGQVYRLWELDSIPVYG